MRFFLVIILISFFSCTTKNKKNPYLITAHQVGKLTDSTQVWQLKQQFPNDSIVVRLEEGVFVEAPDDSYLVYTKAGKLLFTAIAKIQGDSTSTFRKVLVASPIFKTQKGLNKGSYYVDIRNSNFIGTKTSDINRNVVFTMDSISIKILFDRKDLPNSWQNAKNNLRNLKIPDSLQISEFIVNWEY
jgi:hypothetical protein